MDPKSKLVLLFLSASLTMGLVSQAVKDTKPTGKTHAAKGGPEKILKPVKDPVTFS